MKQAITIQAIRPGATSTYQLAKVDQLLAETFGFALAEWRERGLWTADYTTYAAIEGDVVLANASTYRMDLLLDGRHLTAYQIGAVATLAERRGQGLSRMIMEHILAQHPGQTLFLLANENVLDFYPRFGFRPLAAYTPRLLLEEPAGPPAAPAGEFYQLTVDDPAVADYLRNPPALSNKFDCANALPLHWFHLLMAYPNSLFEIPALQALLVLDGFGDILTLVDFWSPRLLDFASLRPYLPLIGIRELRLGFNPDRLGLNCEMIPNDEANLFVRGDFPITGPFTLPLLLRT